MDKQNITGPKDKKGSLRLAIPSDGEMYEPTLHFLESCGVGVARGGARQYIGELTSLPGIVVLFQRAADVPVKVEEGSADLGIVGLDRFEELRKEDGDTILGIDRLGFGSCDLVLAVPDGWLDVSSTADLADLAVEFWEKGKELRIATKYPRLVERFLNNKGLRYFTLVQASGTLEAAPIMGYADVIGDITSSGVTLRENHLKTLTDGKVLSSQGCLIANKRLLGQDALKLQQAKSFLERIEARMRAEGFCALSSVFNGSSLEKTLRQISRWASSAEGPKPRAMATDGTSGFLIGLVVRKERLMDWIERLRTVGGVEMTVTQPQYVFEERCEAYDHLLESIGGV